jgi:type II secretory pathway pseudopilin PulG
MRRRRLLVVLGFSVTVLSTVVSSVWVAKTEKRQQEFRAAISDLQELRAQARASMTESGAKADSASVLFALAQNPQNTANAGSHYRSYSRHAIEQAFMFKCRAIRSLETWESRSCAGSPMPGSEAAETLAEVRAAADAACAPAGRLEGGISDALGRQVDEFFSNPRGVASTYEALRGQDQKLGESWRALDRQRHRDLTACEGELEQAKSLASLLRSLGAALAIVGLMIVLARDLME